MSKKSSLPSLFHQIADRQAQYSFEEAMASSIEYFHGDELAASTFVSKYALQNPHTQDKDRRYVEATPVAMHDRIASELARIDANYGGDWQTSFDEYKGWLDRFRYIVPQGSPMFGIGNRFVNASLSNCVVIDSPRDDISGIADTGKDMMNLFKRRCGVGLDLSTLRPAGANVNNSALTSTGAWSFANYYSEVTRMIGQSGRRGASMLTLDVRHPDVDLFTTMKQDLTKVTGANVSLKVCNAFMEAVASDDVWHMSFPCDLDVQRVIADSPGTWSPSTKERDAEGRLTKLASEYYHSPSMSKKQVIRRVRAKDLWSLINDCARRTAEPGIIFWDNYSANLPACEYDEFQSISTNPCVVGDTKVFVADGRGAVSIRKLATEGVDIPVFCADEMTGKLAVRMMRNPRLAQSAARILKVTFDDGGVLRCTENHGILSLNGRMIPASELVPGSRIRAFTRFQHRASYLGKTVVRKGAKYWHWASGFRNTKSEHRIVAESVFGDIPADCVVPHKDFNSLNNREDNLHVMSKAEHDHLHGESRSGDNNPMKKALATWPDDRRQAYCELQRQNATGWRNPRFSGWSHDEVYEHMLCLVGQLKRRPSVDDWYDYATPLGLPLHFSDYRKSALGGITSLAKRAAVERGIDYVDADPRVVKSYIQALQSGHEARIENGACIIDKDCQVCGSRFTVALADRHHSLCSQRCASKRGANTAGRLDKMRATKHAKCSMVAKAQVDVFLDLKQALSREPLLKEWEQGCIVRNLPRRVGKTSGTFRSYSHLKDEASKTNHRVVSVEFDGYEDVYSGTVDSHANYLNLVSDQTPKHVYVCSSNCSEISLSPYDSCRLISLNLTGFVKNPFTKDATFDMALWKKAVTAGMRMMDNVVDLEIETIQRIIDAVDTDDEKELWGKLRRAGERGRRTGLGTHGLADCLAKLCIKYDTDEGLQMVDKIFRELRDSSYEASIVLAEERGPFPAWDWDVEKNNEFLKRLPKKLRERMAKSGRRNIALLTNAPTGSVAIVSQTSSGIEPVFMNCYTRRKKINANDSVSRVDFVDQNKDKWQEYPVFHHSVLQYLKQSGKEKQWQKIEQENPPSKWPDLVRGLLPQYFVTSSEIDPMMRVKMQAEAQKHIDHGISSTINLPRGTTTESIQGIYEAAWMEGLKGVTVYVDGSRSGVLVGTAEKPDGRASTAITETQAPSRPTSLSCDMHKASINGQYWTVFVGLMDGRPYEVFGGGAEYVEIPRRRTEGTISKRKVDGRHPDGRKKTVYDLYIGEGDDQIVIKDIANTFKDSEYAWATRSLSLSLRHGVPVEYIVQQLRRGGEGSHLQHFSKAIARVLSKYLQDDEEASLIREDGYFCKSGQCD